MGIIPRAISEIATAVRSAASGEQLRMAISVVEIYCEKIRDLLRNPDDELGYNLQVKHDPEMGV